MISVIIPAYNEEDQLPETIRYVYERGDPAFITEVIVADGGSTDRTVELARIGGAKAVISPVKGRAAQMNFGARNARGEILYFLHADTLPCEDFAAKIYAEFRSGRQAGCFMLAFDHDHWFLKANCWFTRFDLNYFRFGDQSLFISREIFSVINGFREDHIVMEDQEIIGRIRKIAGFSLIRKAVTTSARKYLENGIYRTQAVFFLIFFMYKLGYDQARLVSTFRKTLVQHKV
jgi:rSAM/selenodomain-associated transferase 2